MSHPIEQAAQQLTRIAEHRFATAQKSKGLLRRLREAVFPSETGLWGELLNPYEWLIDLQKEGFSLPAPTLNRTDELGTWPVTNEEELCTLRSVARAIAGGTSQGKSILRSLTTFIIYKGFSWEAQGREGHDVSPELVKQTQAVIDEFIERMQWSELEQELFRRSRRDGEYFLRYFVKDGRTTVRTIEPEQIVQPPKDFADGYFFGIKYDEEDAWTPVAYWVSLTGKPEDGEEVDASEIDHVKVNVDRIEPRGISDFFTVREELIEVRKLLRGMRKGGTLISNIAWIEQFATASRSEVQDLADGLKEFTRTNTATGRTTNHERVEPGTVIRTSQGRQFVGPPMATANTVNLVAILQACLRSILSVWGMPEYFSGDASNANYSSTLVAGAPFVRGAECDQEFYRLRFASTMKRAVRNAVDDGILDKDALTLVEVFGEPPVVPITNKLEQAQVNEIRSRNGVLSIQTWQQQDGLDSATEAKNLAEMPPPAQTPVAPPLPGFGAMQEGRAALDPFALLRRVTS